MSDMAYTGLIAAFQAMLAQRWGYIPGASGQLWTQQKQDSSQNSGVKKYGQQWVGHQVADCSGAFVYAFREHGMSIYHGSNRIARRYVAKLLPIEQARPGMAAFKYRAPGAQLYALPAEYRPGGSMYNGDVNDYYHIGLVDSDPRYVLNSQGVRTGFVRSKIADNWQCAACLLGVDYGEEEEPVDSLYSAVVTAENGQPVNLRKGPSLSAARICTLPVGTRVEVMNETNDDWAEIAYGDVTGYMMRKFLKKTGETGGSRLAEISRLLEEAQRLLAEEMEQGG